MKEPTAVAFGKALRKARKAFDLSQEDLGIRAGLQQKSISFLELGEKQPTITTVFKLAAALNMRPKRLVELVEEEFEDTL